MAEIASAYVSLLPSMRGFSAKMDAGLEPEIKRSGTRLGTSFGKMFAAAGAGLLAGAGIKSLLSDSIAEAREAQKVGALTAQVIKSTGGAANVTAAQVGDLSAAISKKVGIDDEAIQSGTNLLLTFKNVRNETGNGNKIFNRATTSIVDMASAMAAASGGQVDFRSATTLVGKALNDPIKGLTALSRVGVTFSQQQKDQIKKLTESGKTMDAQKMILRELKSEFGGAAAAQATAGDKLRVSWGNLQETIGTGLLPILDKGATKLTTFVDGMQDGTGAGGAFVDVLHDAADVGKSVYRFFDSIPGPVKKYGTAVAIAAIATSKLNGFLGVGVGALGTWSKQMLAAETRAAAVGRASYALGAGIRNLAGAGGMVLLASSIARTNGDLADLTRSASTTNDQMRFLKSTGGAAALGLMTFGPVGAVVGAAGGALNAVWQNGRAANAVAQEGAPKIDSYASSFDRLRGSATGATRSIIENNLAQTGAVEAARLLGLNQKTLINAILGREAAEKKVNSALAVGESLLKNGTVPHLKNGADAYNALKQSLFGYSNASGKVTRGLVGDYRQQERAAKRNAATIAAGKTILESFPTAIKTRFENGNLPQTEQGIARLAAKQNLARKEVRTLLTAVGVKPTRAAVQSVIDKMKQADKMRARPTFNWSSIDTGNRKLDALLGKLAKAGGASIATAAAGGPWSGRHQTGTPRDTTPRRNPAGRLLSDGITTGRLVGEGITTGIEGSSDRVGKAAEKLGKKALKKLRDTFEKKTDKKTDLNNTLADMIGGISSAYMPDLFSGGLGNLTKGLTSALAGTKNVFNNAIPALLKGGINASGGFFQQLMASGNTQLITALAANPALAKQYESQYKELADYSSKIGNTVARASEGGQTTVAAINKVTAKLDKIEKVLKANDAKAHGNATARALDKTAATAKKKKGPKRK